MESWITIQRTRDASLLRRLALDPKIFPYVSDDYTRDPAKWTPAVNDLVMNLVALDHKGYFGFGIFIPRTHSCFEAHLGFLPRSYGWKARNAFRDMLGWMWQNTTAARVIGEIPRDNHRAIAFAKRVGCQIYGLNPQSSLRGGKLRDQVCLGISRP